MKIFIGCTGKEELLSNYSESFELLDEISKINNVELLFSHLQNKYLGNIIEGSSHIKKLEEIYDKSDVILILPGGLGTMAELFSAIVGKKFNNKKIILYNVDYFYTPIIKYLYKLYEEGFIDNVPANYMVIESDYKKIIEMIEEMN